MADSLPGWLNKSIRRKPHTEHAVLDVLPKRRDLTPPDAAATAASGLFQRLPTEIRRQILTAAFGGRVIHVDLSPTHEPRTQKHAAPKERRRHRPASLFRAAASASSQSSDGRGPRGEAAAAAKRRMCTTDVHFVKPEVRTGAGWDFELPCSCGGGAVCWQWLSRVCQHQNLGTLRHGLDDFRRPSCDVGCCWPTGPENNSQDECVHGRTLSANTCHWHIGVSGWLRTCKQAYLEGTDILYGTNTFQLSGTISKLHNELVLLHHLPDVLPSEKIRSVKLTWSRIWARQRNQGPLPEGLSTTDRREFQKFLEAIPRSLPNVKALYLCLFDLHMYTSEPWDTNENFKHSRQAETDIFLPVDDMFRRLGGQLHEFYVGVPFTVFKHRFEAGGPKGLWLEPAHQRRIEAGTAKLLDVDMSAACRRQRVWRRLPRTASSDGEEAADASRGDGYWINKSCSNINYISYCFGSGPNIEFSKYPSPYALDPD